MPTHTIHSALTSLHSQDGAPWKYAGWQELTGIKHGLFPVDDAHLPPGITREHARLIAAYFDMYNKKSGEAEKVRFASAKSGGQAVPGRDLWRKWVTQLWKTSDIHSKIAAELTELKLHPLHLALSFGSDNLDPPVASTYLPNAIDPVSSVLFGDDALDHNERLHFPLRQEFQAIIQRTWIVLKNLINRSRGRIEKLEAETTTAFNNLDKDEPTKKQIKAIIIKVRRWKTLAELLCTTANIEKIAEMDGELQRLMIGLGANIKVTAEKPSKALSKISASMLESLASREDVNDIFNLYDEFFNVPDSEDPISLVDQRQTITFKFAEAEGNADPGMDQEANMSPDMLAQNLGFPEDRLPLLFNRYHHRGGLTSWDDPDAFEAKNAEHDSEMAKLALHWHQLAGVHAFLRLSFSKESTSQTSAGGLNADEVGLGKTFQVVTIIACLSDLIYRQTKKLPTPPIFQQYPYLGDSTTLPDLPHLVIVPGTLLSQWESELKVLIRPKSFDILIYNSKKALRDQFWAPGGPFHSSLHEPRHRIILATQSAVQADFSSVFAYSKPKAPALPWTSPKGRKTEKWNTTLYGQQYLSVTLDEAQFYRNAGAKHSSILEILLRTKLRMIVTATPLQTSVKDLYGMGRLVGLPFFSTQEAYDSEKDDLNAVRRAKASALAALSADTDESLASVDKVQQIISQRLQLKFEGRLLRRTGNSLDWQNEVLIPLPGYDDVTLLLRLTEREMLIITDLADAVKLNIFASNSILQIVSRAVYGEHRRCVGFAQDDLTDPIPKFNAIPAWEKIKSTKIDACVQLCKHILTHNNASGIVSDDGVIVYPSSAPVSTEEHLTKILIYQEFTSLTPLLRNILTLYKMKHLCIDGRVTYRNRAKIVEQFKTDPTIRILIVSAVGATGLNLTVANVLIFLDQPWSAQDEKQIRGRIYRPPQKQRVQCFHLIADETADVILASLARGKETMLQAFLDKDKGREMLQMFQGATLHDEQDDLDSEDADDAKLIAETTTVTVPANTKKAVKRGKATKSVDESGNVVVKAAPKKKTGKGKKVAAETLDEMATNKGPKGNQKAKAKTSDAMMVDNPNLTLGAVDESGDVVVKAVPKKKTRKGKKVAAETLDEMATNEGPKRNQKAKAKTSDAMVVDNPNLTLGDGMDVDEPKTAEIVPPRVERTGEGGDIMDADPSNIASAGAEGFDEEAPMPEDVELKSSVPSGDSSDYTTDDLGIFPGALSEDMSDNDTSNQRLDNGEEDTSEYPLETDGDFSMSSGPNSEWEDGQHHISGSPQAGERRGRNMITDSPDNLKYVKRVRTRSADTRPSSPSPTNKTGSTEDLLPKPTHSALSSALPRVPAINRPVLNVPRREQPVLAHSLVADSPFIVERVRSIPKQPPTSAPLQRPAPRPSKRIERPHGVSSWLHGPSTPSSPLPLSPPELIATTSQPTQPPLSSKFPKSHGLGFASSSTPLAQSSSPFLAKGQQRVPSSSTSSTRQKRQRDKLSPPPSMAKGNNPCGRT